LFILITVNLITITAFDPTVTQNRYFSIVTSISLSDGDGTTQHSKDTLSN